MAKDPAILWYWNDWNGGTSTFTRHLKGCYIDLLSSQFNSGRLSLAEIKTVLGADFGPSWPALQKKFKKDESGMYYNERMEEEQEKRKRFTDGRRKNLLSKKQKSNHKTDHVGKNMETHVEDVNEDDNETEFKEEGLGETVSLSPGGFFSNEISKDIELSEIEIGATVEFIRLICKKVLDNREVVDRWSAFKIKQLSVKDWYNSHEKLINHFRESLKYEFINGNKNGKTGQNGQHRAVITGTASGSGSFN